MVVGAVSSRTELAIIGSGPGGYVAALRAADAGLDVTLIERAELGGTCLNVGCIPSKALIELANTRQRVVESTRAGLHGHVSVDGAAIHRHLSSVSAGLRTGVASLLQDAGVTIRAGTANFARYDRLIVSHDGQVGHLEFDNCIVACGSRPIELSGFEFDGTTVLSSTGALALEQLPTSAIIVGGGYIGVEIGTAWAKLGVRVSIVEAAPTILPDVASQLRRPVERRLRQLGITVHTAAVAERRTSTGLRLGDGSDIEGETVVVAVGRQPNTDLVSLATLPVEMSASGHVQVNDQMRATRGVYAIGDIVAGPALAHRASAQAEVAVDAIMGHASTFDAAIPAVIFSDPEIFSVGVELGSAPGTDLTVHRFPHAASARAKTLSDVSGATYIVADEHGTVVGVHAVGPHVSELSGEATLAIELAATVEDLARTIHAHPTMSETLAEGAWLAHGLPLHVRR